MRTLDCGAADVSGYIYIYIAGSAAVPSAVGGGGARGMGRATRLVVRLESHFHAGDGLASLLRPAISRACSHSKGARARYKACAEELSSSQENRAPSLEV